MISINSFYSDFNGAKKIQKFIVVSHATNINLIFYLRFRYFLYILINRTQKIKNKRKQLATNNKQKINIFLWKNFFHVYLYFSTTHLFCVFPKKIPNFFDKNFLTTFVSFFSFLHLLIMKIVLQKKTWKIFFKKHTIRWYPWKHDPQKKLSVSKNKKNVRILVPKLKNKNKNS